MQSRGAGDAVREHHDASERPTYAASARRRCRPRRERGWAQGKARGRRRKGAAAGAAAVRARARVQQRQQQHSRRAARGEAMAALSSGYRRLRPRRARRGCRCDEQRPLCEVVQGAGGARAAAAGDGGSRCGVAKRGPAAAGAGHRAWGAVFDDGTAMGHGGRQGEVEPELGLTGMLAGGAR